MSTKYLSSFIDGFQTGSFGDGTPDVGTPQPFAGDVQAEELKQILLDAKEGLEVKNTTHEFYETLERITNELRGMTEHSTAFLSRVRKSDAPDYFNIIKNPMDLGTVLKKVKAQQYKDKSSFKADLDLIWDNCLLYNTLPNHPLRRSAMTLRSRANHLLEFVTDPIASTPIPQVTHSQSASRFDRPGSRLDALDATHVVISTANLLGEPKGFSENGKPQESPYEMDYLDNFAALKHEEKEGSSLYEEDFQDIEDDEEDESIRTRKGLTSHKSQPGGGRNLELLKGLAAQSPSAEVASQASQADSTLSIYPSGLDAEGSPSGSAIESTAATPGPAAAQVPSIPEVPGTYPGQGSVLLARRATGTTHISRDRRIKTRTPSMPPLPATVPLAQRPALLRTPEMMAKFAELDSTQGGLHSDGDNKLQQNGSETEGLPALITLALNNDFAAHAPVSSPASTSSRLASHTPSSYEHPDLEWWQTVCSDALLANGLPDVPAIPCKRTKAVRQKVAGLDREKEESLNPCWSDLTNLKRIKRTHHKLAVLRRDAPGISPNTAFEDGGSSEDEHTDLQNDSSASNSKRKALLKLGASTSESANAAAGQLTLQVFCSTLLEHAGFDYVQRSALDNISNLLVQYLSSLGSAAAFHRDRHKGRPSLGSMLKSALHDVAADDTFPVGRDPLAALARYRETDIPEHSRELASLSARLVTAYDLEIEEAQHHEPRLKLEKNLEQLSSLAGEDEEETSNPAEYRSSYALLRMLLESESDHLSLEELQIPSDTGFPLHLLYASILRQTFSSSCVDLSTPFDPPPPFVSLVPLSESQSRPQAIQSTIGILQPFLQARSQSAYDLYDDDDLPLSTQTEVQKGLGTRPEVPHTTGRVVLGKRKRDVVPAAAATAIVGLNISTSSAVPGASQGRPTQATDKAKKAKAL